MEIFYEMFKPGLELEDFIKVLIESDIEDKIIFNALDSYLKK
jgi:hypothetical protein